MAGYLPADIRRERTAAAQQQSAVYLIQDSSNEFTRIRAGYSLGKIDKHNPVAISTLLESVGSYSDRGTNFAALALHRLGQIGKDNPVVISALVDLIANHQNENIRSVTVSKR